MRNEFRLTLRNDFLSFARKALFDLAGIKVGDEQYLEYLASELMDFVDGKTRRELINIPPRHLKTLLSAVCMSAWILAHDPTAKIMVVSYSEQLSAHIARSIRAILQSIWFKEIFKTRVAKDHSAVMDFATTAGGALYSVSFGGSITGRGADFIIIDDPHDIADAGNPRQLEHTIELFRTVVLSRLNNRKTGKVIVNAHRIHKNLDLSADLLRDGRRWKHIVLPMEAVTDSTYETAYGPWHRRKGDLLRPAAFDADDLEELKADTHNPDFELLYQQDAGDCSLPPIAEDCFLNFTGLLSGDLACVMSVDAGMAPGVRNSFSTIQIWCPVGTNHYLVAQWREQCEFAELRRRSSIFIKRHRPSAIIIEKAANGIALASMMKPRDKAIITEITPRGSKTSRIRRHIDTILARQILLPENASWRDDFVAEFVNFPHGDLSDQVDATTQYLDWALTHPRLEKRPQPGLCAGVNSRGQPLSTAPPNGRFIQPKVWIRR